MMEEDPWDSLLQLEGKAFEDGVQEGTQEARKSAEVREKGIAAGSVVVMCLVAFIFLNVAPP